MIQIWRVIAPGRKEVTGSLGELVDALFSSSAGEIVPLLTVPSKIHSRKMAETIEVVPGENVEDEEDDVTCARRSRTNGLPSSHFSQSTRIQCHDASAVTRLGAQSRSKTLCSLPSDIHDIIFASLTNPIHVLCLSLTNRYFWAIGLPHIEGHIMRSLAPWAGERLLCISEQTDPHELPPGLLSPSEQAAVNELNQIYNIDQFSIRNSWKKIGAPSLSQQLQEWFLTCRTKHTMTDADRNEIMMGLKPEISEFSQPWILRNLTTKEYVRGEAIALKDEFLHGPQIDVFGFAEVLISRISWSSAPVQIGKINIAHGKWAGHRFDISPMSAHEQTADCGSWRDVSDEIFREMDLIMTARKGDDWREHLTRQYAKTKTPIPLGYA